MSARELTQIATEIAQCQRCPLYKTATKPVPGAGNPEAKLVFIGEAPGFHEDQQGLPFVGAAGKLLEKLLGEIGLSRDKVWIGNMLKHRPPNNRDPLPDELIACKPFLARQLEIINPELIVTLGRFAMNYFLPNEIISRAHGIARYVVFNEKKRILIPVYHPAAALRNGGMMTSLRLDFEKVAQFLARRELVGQSPQPAKPENPTRQMGLF